MSRKDNNFEQLHLYLEESYLLIPPTEEKKRNEEAEKDSGITIIEVWSDPEE